MKSNNRKNNKRKFIPIALITISLVFIGCSLTDKKDPSQQTKASSPDYAVLQKFQRGSEHMDNGEYKKAAQIFESIVVENPTSQVDLLALYNVGSAHESLRHCKKAAKYFRKTAKASRGTFFKIEAQALLRLSYAYECLRRDDKVVISLIDIRRKTNYLPRQIGLAEVPARLGAAYARLGNQKLAEQFFREAEKGIHSLRDDNKDPYGQKELLAQTLFLMGKIDKNTFSFKKPRRYISLLNHQQVYLLKSVELDNKKWSKRAVRHLIELYDHLWKTANKPLQSRISKTNAKKFLARQMRVAQGALNNLQELKKQRFPKSRETRLVSGLFTILGQHERNFTSYLDWHGSKRIEPRKPDEGDQIILKKKKRLRNKKDSN